MGRLMRAEQARIRYWPIPPGGERNRTASYSASPNYMHPGFVKTDILRETPWILRTLLKALGGSVEKGAETLVYLASAPQVKGVTGKYFASRREKPFKGMVADPVNWKRATDIGMKLSELSEVPA